MAITGLYFFDNKVIKFAKQLKPSSRNELEITDLLNKYKRRIKKMPFKSKKQRAWMHKNKPKMAKKWEKETRKGAKLPTKVKKKKTARRRKKKR